MQSVTRGEEEMWGECVCVCVGGGGRRGLKDVGKIASLDNFDCQNFPKHPSYVPFCDISLLIFTLKVLKSTRA